MSSFNKAMFVINVFCCGISVGQGQPFWLNGIAALLMGVAISVDYFDQEKA